MVAIIAADEKTASSVEDVMDFESCNDDFDDSKRIIETEMDWVQSQDISADCKSPDLQQMDLEMLLVKPPTAEMSVVDESSTNTEWLKMENENLKMELQQSRLEFEKLVAEKVTVFEQSVTENNNLKSQIATIEDQFMLKVSSLENMLDDNEEHIRELKTRYRAEIAQLKDDILVKDRFVMELNHNIDNLEAAKNETSSLAALKQGEIIEMRGKVANMEQTILELQSKTWDVDVERNTAQEQEILELKTMLQLQTEIIKDYESKISIFTAQSDIIKNDYETKVFGNEHEILGLKNSNLEKTLQVEQLVAEVTSLKEKLTNNETTLKMCQDEIQEYVVKCQELVLLHHNASTDCKLAREELVVLQQGSAESAKVVNDLHNKISELSAKVQLKQDVINQMQNDQNEKPLLVKEMLAELESVLMAKQATSFGRLADRLELISTSFVALQVKSEQLLGKHQSKKNLIHDLNQAITRSRQNSASSQENLASLQTNLETMSKQLEAKEKIILELKNTIEFGEQEQTAMYEESAKLVNELQVLKLEKLDSQQEIEKLEAVLEGSNLFKAQFETTLQKLEELQSEFSEYETMVKQYQQQDQIHQKSLVEAEQVNAELNSNLEAVVKEREVEKQMLQNQISTANELLVMAQKELLELKQSISSESEALKMLHNEKKDLISKLEDSSAKSDQLIAERDQLVIKMAIMQNEAAELQNTISESSNQAQTKEEQIKALELEIQNRASESQIKTMESELKSVSDQLDQVLNEKSELLKEKNEAVNQSTSLGQEILTLRGEIKILRETIQRRKKTQKIASLNAIPEDAVIEEANEESKEAEAVLTVVEPKKRTRKRRESIRLDHDATETENQPPKTEDITPIKKRSRSQTGGYLN